MWSRKPNCLFALAAMAVARTVNSVLLPRSAERAKVSGYNTDWNFFSVDNWITLCPLSLWLLNYMYYCCVSLCGERDGFKSAGRQTLCRLIHPLSHSPSSNEMNEIEQSHSDKTKCPMRKRKKVMMWEKNVLCRPKIEQRITERKWFFFFSICIFLR